ncbi:MAG: patatin-like phospholipase family protein [Treponema sp.]|jgi:NTE family protein|nr:patatin-like phospholipase family protein [Treponema sp.]
MRCRFFSVFLFLALLGASPVRAQEADVPEPSPSGKPPKIALVLSGGAALGFAHVGFLKVLEEVGIPVDMVVGNSMGSLVGALYAVGYSPGDIEAAASQINWAGTFLNQGPGRTESLLEERYPLVALAFDRSGTGDRKGLLPDQNITLLFSRLVYRVSMRENFADLPLPFKAIAVDIAGGIGVPLEHGVLYRAMRASMSIPLVFPPVPLQGSYMVDGALLNNNPVDLALEWGADIIIDVDVGSFAARKTEEIDNIGVVADQAIRLIQSAGVISNMSSGREDYRLDMDLSEFFWTDFGKSRAIIDKGEKNARSAESLEALSLLAAEIEKFRPLEKKDWRRRGTYEDLPEPVFSGIRLVSIGADGLPEPEKTAGARFPRRYLNSLFERFFDKPVDFSQLEATIGILRLRGNFENVGYHLEAEDGEYVLVLTGVQTRQRKNDFSFAIDAEARWGEGSRLGMTDYINLNFRDLFLPKSLLSTGLSYRLADIQGPTASLAYGKELSPLFTLGLGVKGAYYTSSITSFQSDRELSSFGFLDTKVHLVFRPANFFEMSAMYRYKPLWYENKESGLAYKGGLHSAGIDIGYDTLYVTQPLFFTFLYNTKWLFSIEFPFAGSRLWEGNTFPWYEQLDFSGRKAWVVHPWRNFVSDVEFASYRGELESKWTLFSPAGKNGIPGYSGDAILGRNKLILGLAWLEEIKPLSNLFGIQSFFNLTLRGGSVWQQIDSLEQFKQWRGGLRTGLQLETPAGRLFFGPEVSFEGKVQFSIYYN